MGEQLFGSGLTCNGRLLWGRQASLLALGARAALGLWLVQKDALQGQNVLCDICIHTCGLKSACTMHITGCVYAVL